MNKAEEDAMFAVCEALRKQVEGLVVIMKSHSKSIDLQADTGRLLTRRIEELEKRPLRTGTVKI